MDEKKGKFVQGAWVEDPAGPGEEKVKVPLDQRIDQVSGMVASSLHEVLGLARDLIATPEGHAHIEREVHQAASQIERAISEIISSVSDQKNDDKSQKKEKKIRIE